MARPDPAAPGLALAAAVMAVAATLAVLQWRERRRRTVEPGSDDARHFARQDVRRLVGAALMGLVALGLALGSRIDPRLNRWWRRVFVVVWLIVGLLIIALLVLAWLDWLSIRVYARRHRRAIFQGRVALLKEELRRRRRTRNGPPRPGDFPAPE